MPFAILPRKHLEAMEASQADLAREVVTHSSELAIIKRMLARLDTEVGNLSQMAAATMTTVNALRQTMAEVRTNLTNIGVQAMATLQDIQNAVAAEQTVEQSVITLLQQLSAQLQAAIAGNDPNAMQAVVDQINANAQALADAVAQNTPQPPAPPSP